MSDLPIKTKTGTLLQTANIQQKKQTASISRQMRDFESSKNARQAFLQIKSQLLSINEWNDHSSKMVSFELFDKDGKVITDRAVGEETFLRIYLKGSGAYDWVKFIEIFQSENELVLKVKPVFDPTAEVQKKQITAHFLTGESANHFCLLKVETILHLCVIGLDEKQNTSECGSLLSVIRNFATANIGYYLGVQKNQWTTFCRNFLGSIDENQF